jgi:hypothetical protein
MPLIFKDYKIRNCSYKIEMQKIKEWRQGNTMQMKKKVGQEDA